MLVPIKRVIDYTVKIRVNKGGIEKKNAKMSMNPFCEIAVEEAVRMKEAKKISECIAITIGDKKATDQLRTAMAMGCDRAIHVPCDYETDVQLQPLAVARILKVIVERETPDLILLGKQSIDDDSNNVGQMLAGMLNWPQCTFASEIKMDETNKKCEVLREIDGGGQRVSMVLPGIITTDLRLNEPRFATLPNIMKARKKKIEEISIQDLGVNIDPELSYEEITEPTQRQAGIKVESVEELYDKLKEKGLI